jgi:hypothetical protein
MSIHYYTWLYIANEEEVEVEEERTPPPPPKEHQAGICFYFDICRFKPDSPVKNASPGAFSTILDSFKIFLTCLMH